MNCRLRMNAWGGETLDVIRHAGVDLEEIDRDTEGADGILQCHVDGRSSMRRVVR